ncbi:hypothetical protein [Pelomonas sp. KK5]|uniref:hypothetical protein n=1 Tax=Pelomonas sp. KK5 TaxID=1855730 RepID=UPI00097CAC5E|nr:hypothetical protein [Pelomonas sp. KK5]
MADIRKNLIDSWRRHFVTLSCMQQPSGAPETTALVFSGFVVEIEGEWFYVTAGHILDAVEQALAKGNSLSHWRLTEHLLQPKFGNKGVPYDLDIRQWYWIHDEARGLDYAITHLRQFYRDQLEAGGVLSLARKGWNVPHPDQQWGLMGVPSESVDYDGETLIGARLVMVALEPAEAPEGAGAKAENVHYARLADGSEQVVRDVDGMSGGPVFAVGEVDGQTRYGIIGVQSAWYASTRTIAFCPFMSFVIELIPHVREALEEAARLERTQSAQSGQSAQLAPDS